MFELLTAIITVWMIAGLVVHAIRGGKQEACVDQRRGR